MFKPVQFVSHVPLHPDGASPINRVRRLDHEHELADYDWDERTGVATCTYETKELAEHANPVVRYINQPASRRHIGWRTWDGRRT